MLNIDGDVGEGGGQIVRSSLALAMCLDRPFRITRIRARRERPGLQAQHLAAVSAAASVSQAHVEGAYKGSQELLFKPRKVIAGDYHFAIGTAGSTSLVLQTVLPALILADRESNLLLEGGTHNPLAPPFDFLKHAFLPLLNRMGPAVTATLERPGFAPEGGGRVRVHIKPVAHLQALELPERGDIVQQRAEVLLAHLPEHIANRELAVIRDALSFPESKLNFRVDNTANGPGNAVSIIVESAFVTECFTAFGQRRLPAERVAESVVREVRRYLQAGVPVGRYLADQLLLPLALAGEGMFVTLQPSSHVITNMAVVKKFMQAEFASEKIDEDAWRISLS
ncbi:RNA 3'-terminal phosphate cyclase [Sulfuriflexus mobilis]|uniref:RNA 3'-terminal phosphate cyclase n=1 Tax=Sulfuriflexus mobilis TaxID=1811807 RepID=UPI000F821BF3|nr:RNA 3'-terminal phosphate cyclase [Sulfuriflexus mobilis]